MMLGVAYATESMVDVNRQRVSKEKDRERVAVPLKAKLTKTISKEWYSYTVTEHWTFEHTPVPDGNAGNKVPAFTPIVSMLKPQYIISTYLDQPSFPGHTSSGVVYSIPFQIPTSAKKLTVKDALGWITNFARRDNVLLVQPRYPFANGWKGEIIIKYVVKDVNEASNNKLPFDELNVETELIDGGDITNYRSLLLFPLILPLGYWVLKDIGKSSSFDRERNRLLLAVRKVSDLKALRECKPTDDATLQDLYERQLNMIEVLLQCGDPTERRRLGKELVSLDEKILVIECNHQ